VGDFARFGATVFQILAPLQLAMGLFFSAVMAASAVAQEKDRRTLVLLLLTNLSNSELVLGKLLAAMLSVLTLLAAALPVFMLVALFGGVSYGDIAKVFAITLMASLASGSLGSMFALWREKTFQTLSLTVLGLVAWLAFGEALARGAFGATWLNVPTTDWAIGLSPWQAILATVRPTLTTQAASLASDPVLWFVLFSAAVVAALNGVSIGMVRIWNPSRETQWKPQESDGPESIWGAEFDANQTPEQAAAARLAAHAAPGRTRHVRDNPILWREVSTWAYGRRVLVIRFAYLVLCGLAALALVKIANSSAGLTFAGISLIMAPVCVLSLALINAQAVTALTSERDVKALDLLLVTDLTAKEFVYGKLAGVLFNTKEMALVPLAFTAYIWWVESISGENAIYLSGGILLMVGFVAMLGVHAGMTYENSRTAIFASLGTLFFLLIGIVTCMRMMIAFSGSFQFQLQPFLAFMCGGSIGLYVALGSRNPSSAIAWASGILPIATFVAITSFWQQKPLETFLITAGAYGFTTASILIPAVYEFDVATGRTNAGGD
jgi:ABC-type transport system involved in multi-copper enzyme maturation permease subunit